MQRPTSLHGFTLIELLVVVAIIVTLLAILLPSLGKAVATAEMAVCASNLKQLGYASLTYRADHNNMYWPRTLNGGGSVYYWAGTEGASGGYQSNGADDRYLNPYLGVPGDDPDAPVEIAHCPSDTTIYESTGNSYGCNNASATGAAYPSFNLYNGSGGASLSATSVTHPGTWVLAAEHGANVWAWGESWQYYDTYHWHFPVEEQRWNILFGDGHVGAGVHVPTGKLRTGEYDYDYR